MTPENEALRGELFSAWLDDLRQDRPPRDHPAVRALPPADVAEVLRLARWHKGSSSLRLRLPQWQTSCCRK